MIGGVSTLSGKIDRWQITFNITPTNAKMELKDLNQKMINPISSKDGQTIYKIPAGIYFYTTILEDYINKQNVRLEVYKDETIQIELKTYEIVPFATATDDQIKRMLNAHYNGEIDIADYWKIGDTKTIHINEIPSDTNVTESHVAQNMTFVVIGINHDNLVNQIGEKTKASLTLQCREVLSNNGTAETGYYWGTDQTNDNNSNWSKSTRRTWMNEKFIGALPSTLQPLVKEVIKQNLSSHNSESNPVATNDKAFLISYPEIMGTASHNQYISDKTKEGTQYEYYKTAENRKKYTNNNGQKTTTGAWWWGRSPMNGISANDYSFCVVNSSGVVADARTYGHHNAKEGIAPAFCL